MSYHKNLFSQLYTLILPKRDHKIILLYNFHGTIIKIQYVTKKIIIKIQ